METDRMQGCTSGMEYGIRELHRKSFEISFDLNGTDYIACKNIGSGTYGIVCSAVNSRTGEHVAIKKVLNVCENSILARRTYREMKILQHFRHDNVIRIREILAPRDINFSCLYFVFDLMESDLHQVIRSSQPLTDEHVRYFLYQILRGLKYIHSANVIHRDLKPGNLLVNQDCELKIGDFGMARTIACSNDDFIHQAPLMTQYVATRWYRAPELMLFRRQYTVDVDTWSVGCIFAEMLARKPIFPGNDLMHQLTLILNVLGSPKEDFISLAHSDRVKDFLRKLEKKDSVTLKVLYPMAHPKALKLLEKMLKWNPCDRISIEDALKDLYLNTYHDIENEPICTSPLNFDIDEEKVTDISELRDIIYQDIMAESEDHKSTTSEMSRTEQDSVAKTSEVQLISKTVCSPANHTGVSETAANTVVSKCTQPNDITFNKPIVTVTHQLADGKVVVSFVVNRQRGKAMNPSETAPSLAVDSTIAKRVAKKSTVASDNRSCAKSLRGKMKSKIVSRYQSILPAAATATVREVTTNDTEVSGASVHLPNAKAILRAAILSGRRKEPVAKTLRGRPKKIGKVPNQEKQHADCFMNLSEEDRNMLARWKQMQEKPVVGPTTSTNTPVPKFSTIQSRSKPQTFNVVTCNTASATMSTSVGVSTKGHHHVVDAINMAGCKTSLPADRNRNPVPDSIELNNFRDTDLSKLTASVGPQGVDIIGLVSGDVTIVPDSSDMRLIDQCIAGDVAHSWSPLAYLSNGDVDISKTLPKQTSSVVHVTEEDHNGGSTVVQLPVMVESLSLDSLRSSSLDYLPSEQFKDTLTLADIVGCGESDTPLTSALQRTCDDLITESCNRQSLNTSKTGVQLETTSGHDAFKLFSGFLATESSRDVMESSPPVNNDVCLSSVMQIGSVGSGSGYGLGYDIDALLLSAGVDAMMDTVTSASWTSVSGNVLVSNELDALIDQVLDDNSWTRYDS